MANETKSIVESISVRVPPPNLSSSSSSSMSPPLPPNPRSHCNHSKYCCSTQLLLQNYANFSCSAAPARLMYYEKGSWLDFSSEVLQNARLGFLKRKPLIEVSIDSSEHYFDFMRMLQIDIVNAKQRSIAWIDDNGICFFPKTFVHDEFKDFVEKSENQEIEIEIKTIDDCPK